MTLSGFSQDKMNCDVVFSAYVSNNYLSTFCQKVSNGSSEAISYNWNFGDGYTSTQQNPEHVYLQPGNYVTCLTVQFDNDCMDTYCDTIHISYLCTDTTKNYGISGNVYAGSALLPEGIVVLLIKDSCQNYRAVRYTKIEHGVYAFNFLKNGKYILYAIPYFNVNAIYTPNYFPTYYGNELQWQDAVWVQVDGFYDHKDIWLKSSDDIVYGDDTISGTVSISDSTYFEYNVYLNNWFSDSLPSQIDLQLAPNQVLLLLDENDKTQRFSLSNHNGQYAFYHLPSQLLKLRLEKQGINSVPVSINLTESNGKVNFIIQPHAISIDVKENALTSLCSVNVYPNPVETAAFVHITTDKPTPVSIMLYDVNGKIIFNQTFKNNLSENYLIPCAPLSAGAYLLKVVFPDTLPFQTILIKK